MAAISEEVSFSLKGDQPVDVQVESLLKRYESIEAKLSVLKAIERHLAWSGSCTQLSDNLFSKYLKALSKFKASGLQEFFSPNAVTGDTSNELIFDGMSLPKQSGRMIVNSAIQWLKTELVS